MKFLNVGMSMYFPAIIEYEFVGKLEKKFSTCKVNPWASWFGASSYNSSQASNAEVPTSEKLKDKTVLKLSRFSSHNLIQATVPIMCCTNNQHLHGHKKKRQILPSGNFQGEGVGEQALYPSPWKFPEGNINERMNYELWLSQCNDGGAYNKHLKSRFVFRSSRSAKM